MSAEQTDGNRSFSVKTADIADLSVTDRPVDDRLTRLFSGRLIFVMGKGGVGKTTVSILLANAARRMNKRVLLTEIGDTDSIGRLYRELPLSEEPRRLSQGVWGARVDPKAELEAYVREHVSPKFIAAKIIRSRLFDYLFEATPGLKEVMSLGRLWRWEKEQGRSGSPRYDLIIVDAPATGHAMSLLRLPDLLINMIRVGPVANQIRGLQRLLKDHRKTSLVLVSLPEELPVNEAVEFYSMANDSLEMPVAATFINCVYPSIFSPPDLKQIASINTREQNPSSISLQLLIESAEKISRRRMDQQKHIDEIYAKADGPVQEIPFCFTNDLTISQIEELSSFVFHHVPGSDQL